MVSFGSACCRDHLHIRGEYFNLKSDFRHDLRITSTYVENTGFDFTAVKNARDHLHIRGEYKIFGYQIFLMIGSPPHTWRIQ